VLCRTTEEAVALAENEEEEKVEPWLRAPQPGGESTNLYKYTDQSCGSGKFIPYPVFLPSRIPDPKTESKNKKE
jgi:hypothetical protein